MGRGPVLKKAPAQHESLEGSWKQHRPLIAQRGYALMASATHHPPIPLQPRGRSLQPSYSTDCLHALAADGPALMPRGPERLPALPSSLWARLQARPSSREPFVPRWLQACALRSPEGPSALLGQPGLRALRARFKTRAARGRISMAVSSPKELLPTDRLWARVTQAFS